MALTLSTDANGWSIIPEPTHPSAKKFYVNPAGAADGWSAGNDTNDGLAISTPFASLNKACQSVTDGQDDHIIIKEGSDHNSETLSHFQSLYSKAGVGPNNPIAIYTENWATGGVRATVTSSLPWLSPGSSAQTMQYIGFFGLETYFPDYNGSQVVGLVTNTTSGAEFLDFLFEDCYFHDRKGVAVQNSLVGGDVLFRRCAFSRLYAGAGNGQGLFSDTYHVTLWECVMYGCGFNRHEAPGKNYNVFDRNIYTTSTNTTTADGGSLTFQRSSSILGCSADQLRTDGYVDNCFYDSMPNNLDIGWSTSDFTGPPYEAGFYHEVKNSVFMDARDSDVPHLHAAHFADSTTSKTGLFDNNIIVNDDRSTGDDPVFGFGWYKSRTETDRGATYTDNGLHNVTISNNIWWNIRRSCLVLFKSTVSANPTATITNCSVTGNKFAIDRAGATDGLVWIELDTDDEAGWVFSNNQYWREGGVAETDARNFDYELGGSLNNYNLSGWQTFVEASATWVDPSYTDSTRESLQAYYVHADGLNQSTSENDDDTGATGTYTLSSVANGNTAVVHGVTYTAQAGSQTITATVATQVDGVVTVTLPGHTIIDGQKISIAGFSPVPDGRYTVTSVVSDDITFSEDGTSSPSLGDVSNWLVFATASDDGTELAAAVTGDNRQWGTAVAGGAGNSTVTVTDEAGIEGNNTTTTGTGGVAADQATLSGGADGDRTLMHKAMVSNSRRGWNGSPTGGWNASLTAPAINDWVRVGFDKGLVSGNYYKIDAGGLQYVLATT